MTTQEIWTRTSGYTFLCIRCGLRFDCRTSRDAHDCKPPKVETGLAT